MEKGRDGVRYSGWNRRLLLSSLFHAHWPPPSTANCSNVLSFQHTWALQTPPSLPLPLLFLSLKSQSCKSLLTPTQLLHSPICSSPVSTFPLNGLTLCLEDCGKGEKKRGREVERDREKGQRQASGCKGECTWMGRLPGHAVRGYCPACQQPLSFNGARISSFWLWQMTGTWGRRGGECKSGRNIHVCVCERKK